MDRYEWLGVAVIVVAMFGGGLIGYDMAMRRCGYYANGPHYVLVNPK